MSKQTNSVKCQMNRHVWGEVCVCVCNVGVPNVISA